LQLIVNNYCSCLESSLGAFSNKAIPGILYSLALLAIFLTMENFMFWIAVFVIAYIIDNASYKPIDDEPYTKEDGERFRKNCRK